MYFTSSCNSSTIKTEKLHKIDTGSFQIEVPSDWAYKKEKGMDSFVGKIVGDSLELSFDYSEGGYANPLFSTEKDYLEENKEDWMPIDEPYYKVGVVYTSGSVQAERENLMKEKGITDTNLVKVEPFQIPIVQIRKEKIDTLKSDYFVTLTYKDTSVTINMRKG
jgi:hypothetical protein